MKSRLLVIGPLPPPHHGVAVSTSLVLRNPRLRSRFRVEHLDTTDRRTIENIGRWDLRNVCGALGALARLARRLRGGPGLLYLPISQGLPGLVRDTLFIRLASARGWTVAAHLRGSELGGVYRRQPAAIRIWLRASFRRIDSLAVLGESVRNVLNGVIPSSRIAVVPNGTPDPGIPTGNRGPVGLYLSNLYPRKGVLEAMEAAVLVTRERPDARFIFAGQCPDPAFESKLASLAAGTDGRVELRPPAVGDEKRKVLSSAGFFLFPPTRQEGHPRVIVEAMAAGLPIITTDRGVIAETVVDGESGFVLPSPVPSELANPMLELIDDPAARERMGRAARSRYLDLYTQEAADGAFERWLIGLDRSGPGRAHG